jgi:hypothetical protein
MGHGGFVAEPSVARERKWRVRAGRRRGLDAKPLGVQTDGQDAEEAYRVLRRTHAHGDEEPGEGCGKVALDFFFVLFLFLRTASRVDLDAPPVAFRSHDMLSSQRPLHCVKFFLEN